jgi:hypothetical protein
MEMNWHYLNNVFLSSKRRRNYKKLSKLAENHLESLKANANEPGIQTLIDRTQPLFDDYEEALLEKNQSKGTASAYVYSLKELLDQMPEKLAAWDAIIQTVFPVKTFEYHEIFALNRSEIYKGNTTQVLQKIKNFRTTVEKYPQLSIIQTQVKDYVIALNDTMDTKGTKKESVELNSDVFDKKYDALAIILYRNLGALIDLYGAEPQQIVRFYMLSLLRTSKKQAKTSNGGSMLTIAPNETVTADFVLLPGKTYLIDVSGDAVLQVYGGTVANQAPTATPTDMIPNSENEITSEELGYPANTLMIFKNTNSIFSATVEIFLLEEE